MTSFETFSYKGGGKPAAGGLGEVSPFTEKINQKSKFPLRLCVPSFPSPPLREASSLGM